MIKARRMRWAKDRRGAYNVLMGKHEERDHLEDLGTDGMIILKWVLNKWDWRTWTGFI
jgi:hypothetical protein